MAYMAMLPLSAMSSIGCLLFHPPEFPMSSRVAYTIRIRQPQARQVSLVGDFNNWHTNDDPLTQVAPDVWERIVELAPGKHRYAFFVIEVTAQGAIRSRILGNGAVLWVPEDAEVSVSIMSHPAIG